jgi:hypothetical protein
LSCITSLPVIIIAQLTVNICDEYICIGMIGMIAVPIIEQTANEDVGYTWAVVFSLLFPSYGLARCYTTTYNNEFARNACLKVDCVQMHQYGLDAKDCCAGADGFTGDLNGIFGLL